MDKKRLLELAGMVTEAEAEVEVSANDKRMYKEEMKDVVLAIMNVWHRAKMMGIDFESFEKDLDAQIDGAKQDLN